MPVYLVEAGFTAAVGEQTNLHLPTNGRAEAIMDTIYENRFAIQNPVQKIVPVNLSLCVTNVVGAAKSGLGPA